MIRTSFVCWLLMAASLALPTGAGAGENAGEIYVVRRGQTLSVIAHDVLGDPRLWPAIYRANRDQIKDPTVLHVGQRLAIPEVGSDPALRESIREEAIAWA
ncbi:MAG: LysM peptidoglycan-binding domain-containing protein, partial [Myxococcales bacterium]|nr:LysM peptidoglycan-binding domain-containing protein [Myxococcales bacterium]